MTIEFNPDSKTMTIDPDTYRRLTQGTPFQRSMNALAMMDGILEELTNEMLSSAGLSRQRRRALKKKSAKSRLKLLKNMPPPGIDADALKAFCD